MLAELLLQPFESFLNRGLAGSAEARALAGQLAGRSLALTIDGTPFDLRLRVDAGRIRVLLADGSAPEAGIRGTPLALGRLLGADSKLPIRDGSVVLTGDAELAGQFEALLRLAAPDLGAELSKVIGEPMASDLRGAARAVADWGEAAGASMARGVSAFLQKDSALLPTADEVREFARGVDRLVDDVERAEARVRRLEEKKQGRG